MQSKTSSFKLMNRTLFLKNLKRCWPVWAGYIFFMTWLIPGVMYFDNAVAYITDIETRQKRIIMTIFRDGLNVSIWLSIFAGILFAITIFSYLQNERACNLIHSIPLTRDTLYSNGIISGMIFMIVPDMFIFGLTNIVAGTYGAKCFVPLLQWLLLTVLINLFFYTLAVLCMLFVGNIVASAFAYTIMIIFADLVITPLNEIAYNMYYGMSNMLINIKSDSWLGILMPGRFFMHIDYSGIDDANGITLSYRIDRFWMIVAVTLIVSIIFTVLSVYLYRIRHSESAGDIIAISFLRPVFRWVFAIVLSLLFTWLFLDSIFSGRYYTKARPILAIIMIVIFGIIDFIIAEMIIRKSFRVFKGIWCRLGVFTAAIIVISVVFAIAGKYASRKVIEPDNCETSYIEINGSHFECDDSDPENKKAIYDIHRCLVDNYEEIVDDIQKGQFTNSIRVRIGNTNVNGRDKEQTREYMLPNSQKELFAMIKKLADENVKAFTLRYADDSEYKLNGGHVYINYSEYAGKTNLTGQLTAADAKLLMEALDKDIEAGNLTFQKAVGWTYGDLFGEPVYSDDLRNAEYATNSGYEVVLMEDPKAYNYCEIEFEYSYNEKLYDNMYLAYDLICFDETCENIIDAIMQINLQENSY